MSKPTVEAALAVTFDDVYNHIHADYYVHRRASYHIHAIVATLAAQHEGASLEDIDSDTLWDIMEASIACLHSPVAGSMVVHEEDLITVAEGGQRIECQNCERVFVSPNPMWVKP